jgi:adenylate cyclase
MLVCSDPLKLLLTVLDPQGGLAFGHAVNRAGDWYGSPVNLASRVTSAPAVGRNVSGCDPRNSQLHLGS